MRFRNCFSFLALYLSHVVHFRNIEDLTSQVNNLEIKVNDSELENEELRERLGMDPKDKLDIEDVRTKKKVKAEQAVALNRALTKEVTHAWSRFHINKQLHGNTDIPTWMGY